MYKNGTKNNLGPSTDFPHPLYFTSHLSYTLHLQPLGIVPIYPYTNTPSPSIKYTMLRALGLKRKERSTEVEGTIPLSSLFGTVKRKPTYVPLLVPFRSAADF
jgi:hypothetical protein